MLLTFCFHSQGQTVENTQVSVLCYQQIIPIFFLTGSMHELDVIDVARQEDERMLMRRWTEYYTSTERSRVLNVISLEFSKTG